MLIFRDSKIMKKFKTSQYLILTVIVVVIIVPLTRLYTVNPNVLTSLLDHVLPRC